MVAQTSRTVTTVLHPHGYQPTPDHLTKSRRR